MSLNPDGKRIHRWVKASARRMANDQREFWSMVAQKYDQVVDLQIGPLTRSIKDTSRSSNIPIEYIKAVKV